MFEKKRLVKLLILFLILLICSVIYFTAIYISERRQAEKDEIILARDQKQWQCHLQCRKYYDSPTQDKLSIPVSNFSEVHNGCFYSYLPGDATQQNKIYNCENNKPVLTYNPNYTESELNSCTQCTNIFAAFEQQRKEFGLELPAQRLLNEASELRMPN